MNRAQLEEVVTLLVASRYPYEVENALKGVEGEDLVMAVGAALARTKIAGEVAGIRKTKAELRGRLGL